MKELYYVLKHKNITIFFSSSEEIIPFQTIPYRFREQEKMKLLAVSWNGDENLNHFNIALDSIGICVYNLNISSIEKIWDAGRILLFYGGESVQQFEDFDVAKLCFESVK